MADDPLTIAQQEEEIQKRILKIKEKIKDLDEGSEAYKQKQQELADQKKLLGLLNQGLNARRKNLEASQALLDIYAKEAKGIRGVTTVRAQQVQVEKDLQALIETQIELGEVDYKTALKLMKQSEKRVEILQQLNKAQSRFLADVKESASAAGDLGKSLGKSMDAFGKTDAAGVMMKFVKALQGGTASMISFATSGAFGIIASFINNIWNMTIGLANMELEFEKATGASQEFSGAVTDTYLALNEFGVTTEMASKAAKSLYSNMTDFTLMAADQRQGLQDATATLMLYGIAQDDLSKGLQIQSKMFGLHGKELKDANADILTLAKNLGRAPAEMAAEFAQAGNSLAKFGDKGMKTFKDLARTAKITGMEIDKLLQMTNKFDTFEGAATQAGKLNAALGGNFVNAMDLMMSTDPVDRFQQIRDSVLNAGLSFQDMSYYQRIFYADAMGLSDVSELALVMSGRMDLLDGATQKTTQDYIELAEQGRKVQSIQDQWNATLAENSEEIIKAMGGVKGFIEGIKKLPEHFDRIVYGLKMFASIIVWMLPIMLMFKVNSFLKARALAKATLATAANTRSMTNNMRMMTILQGQQMRSMGTQQGMTGSIQRQSGALKLNDLDLRKSIAMQANLQRSSSLTTGAINRQSAALKGLGVSSGGAAAGMQGLVGVEGQQIVAANGAAPSTSRLAKATWQLGVAALGILGGLAALIYSLSELIRAVGENDVKFSDLGLAMGVLAGGVAVLMGVMSTFAKSKFGWVAVGMLIAIAGAVYAFAKAASEGTRAQAELNNSMARIGEADFGDLENIGTSLTGLSTALKGAPPENVGAWASAIKELVVSTSGAGAVSQSFAILTEAIKYMSEDLSTAADDVERLTALNDLVVLDVDAGELTNYATQVQSFADLGEVTVALNADTGSLALATAQIEEFKTVLSTPFQASGLSSASAQIAEFVEVISRPEIETALDIVSSAFEALSSAVATAADDVERLTALNEFVVLDVDTGELTNYVTQVQSFAALGDVTVTLNADTDSLSIAAAQIEEFKTVLSTPFQASGLSSASAQIAEFVEVISRPEVETGLDIVSSAFEALSSAVASVVEQLTLLNSINMAQKVEDLKLLGGEMRTLLAPPPPKTFVEHMLGFFGGPDIGRAANTTEDMTSQLGLVGEMKVDTTVLDTLASLSDLDLTVTAEQVKLVVSEINSTAHAEAAAFSRAMGALTQASIAAHQSLATKATGPGRSADSEPRRLIIENLPIKVTLDKELTSKLITDGEAEAKIRDFEAKYVRQGM